MIFMWRGIMTEIKHKVFKKTLLVKLFLNTLCFISVMPLHIKIMSWALIFILCLRFLPGKSIATILILCIIPFYFHL